MRDLLGREAQDVRAAEAVALFCYQVKKMDRVIRAAMGGLNTLVFAGHRRKPRRQPAHASAKDWVSRNRTGRIANAANAGVISTPASRSWFA